MMTASAIELDRTRRTAYADTLRRIADLTESGILPLPLSTQSFSVWFYANRDGRAKAALAAEALAVTWRPETVGDRRYLRAVAKVPSTSVEFALYLDTGEPAAEPTPPPAGVAFAAELNAAAGSAVQS